MSFRNLGILIIAIMFAGCAGTHKVKYVQQHDPIMDRNGGVVLLVDVCNQIDVVGDNDYFVINESKEVIQALVKETRTYLEQNGVQVLAEVTPFVCGAFDTPENTPMKVADKQGDTIMESQKPYGVADELINDPEYLNALTTISTYVFEREMIKIIRHYSKKDTQSLSLIVTDDQLKTASEIIKAKTNASSILYVGLKGTKISGGKKFGQGLFSFTVGMATGIATAGMGTGYWVSYMPGRNKDWKYSGAGLINLESGELVWSSWSSAQGNPLKPEKVATTDSIELLLKDLVFDEEPVEDSSKN